MMAERDENETHPQNENTWENDGREAIEDAAPEDVGTLDSAQSEAFSELEDAEADTAEADDILGREEDWAAHEARQADGETADDEATKTADEEDLEAPCLKGEIEALLFMTNRPLPIEDMCTLLEVPLEDVEDALVELIGDYSFRADSSLEIDDSAEGYILQVRRNYQHLVNKMLPMDLSTAALRTLSVIAIKAPMLQKELIDLRGATAYDHVRELLAHKLISKNRSGSSYRLNVTPTFHQLFKWSGDKKELDILVESELGMERQQRAQRQAEAEKFTAEHGATDEPSPSLEALELTATLEK